MLGLHENTLVRADGVVAAAPSGTVDTRLEGPGVLSRKHGAGRILHPQSLASLSLRRFRARSGNCRHLVVDCWGGPKVTARPAPGASGVSETDRGRNTTSPLGTLETQWRFSRSGYPPKMQLRMRQGSTGAIEQCDAGALFRFFSISKR